MHVLTSFLMTLTNHISMSYTHMLAWTRIVSAGSNVLCLQYANTTIKLRAQSSAPCRVCSTRVDRIKHFSCYTLLHVHCAHALGVIPAQTSARTRRFEQHRYKSECPTNISPIR
ncbi:hypothetical protein BDR03DRAFT_945116 [Suillus americanus]|nr:hypothetical protein BDR03DRAFT_945116 [Suillus americanus]